MIRQALAGLALSTTIATAANADGNAAAQAEAAIPTPTKWSLTEDFTYFNYESDDTLLSFNTTFALALDNGGTLSLSLPVYNGDGDTNVGDLKVGGDFNAFKGDGWNLGLGGGVYLPVGAEEFDSTNINPFFTGRFSVKLGDFDLMQTAEYRFVGSEAYTPWLGTSTDSDILSLGTLLSLSWGDLTVGADLTQLYYIQSEEHQIFVGPAAALKINDSITLDGGVQFPVSQDVSTTEVDIVVGVGLGIKF
jgi:hypothetical protein